MNFVHRRDSNGYFGWLLKKIGAYEGGRGSEKTFDMLWQLHSIDFRYSILNDVNRLKDGLTLRDEYTNETGVSDVCSWPCSVLEVLIMLADKIAEDVLGDYSEDGKGTKMWFWLMLSNLGIMNKAGTVVVKSKGDICVIIERWISRSFEENGVGSPFPLKNPPTDQRKIEIWNQFCNFLSENAYLED